ncbi:MAG: 4Fe-4S binding protein [Candidatus Helarchaeota archaeon]|nr:4Fe-4S binding protein [Candidatus Helarchaeota archaeon]
MKVPIIYFSSSGNTKYVCQVVAKGLNSMDLETELIPLRGIKKHPSRIKDAALFGIGAPIYGANFTPNMIQWMKQLPRVNDDKKFFLIDTCSGLSGVALLKARTILTQKGYKCVGGLELISPTRDSVFWTGFYDYISWNEDEIKRAYNFGRLVAKNYWAGKEKFIKSFRVMPFGRILTKLFTYVERPFFKLATKLMAIDHSKCKRCKLCESLCPMEAINVKQDIYFHPEKCMLCFKCMRNCPEGALYLKIYPKAKFFKGPFQIKGYIEPEKLNFRKVE